MDAPGGRSACALLALCRRAFLILAAVRLATGARVLARVRVRTDRFFALLDDGVVVGAAVRRHFLVRLLHRFTAITLELDHTTGLRALNDARAAAGSKNHN